MRASASRPLPASLSDSATDSAPKSSATALQSSRGTLPIGAGHSSLSLPDVTTDDVGVVGLASFAPPHAGTNASTGTSRPRRRVGRISTIRRYYKSGAEGAPGEGVDSLAIASGIGYPSLRIRRD